MSHPQRKQLEILYWPDVKQPHVVTVSLVGEQGANLCPHLGQGQLCLALLLLPP